MCVVSAVSDWGQGQLGALQSYDWAAALKQPSNAQLQEKIKEVAKLVKDFREAMEAAKVVDKITGQPDCVDPEKAKVEDRIRVLEEYVEKLKTVIHV